MNTASPKSPSITRMRIKEISHSNFRVYGEDVVLSADFKPNRPLVFVGGQNGFGKSTFITSILWCLYGKLMVHVDSHYERMVRNAGGYNKFLASCLNREAKNDNYFVQLTLEHVDLPALPCRELIIKRTFNGKKEELDILLDGSPNDLVDDLGFELFIQEYILPKEVARFFLFDAERITSLAESRGATERRELGNAYEKVLGVKRYVEVQELLGAIRERVLAASGDAAAQENLLSVTGQIGTAQSEMDALAVRDEQIDEELQQLQTERDELALELLAQGFVGDAKDLEELQSQEDDLRNSIQQSLEAFKGHMEVAPLLLSPTWMQALKDQLSNQGGALSNGVVDSLRESSTLWLSDRGLDETIAHELWAHLQSEHAEAEAEISFDLPQPAEVSDWEGKLGWLKEWMQQTHTSIKRDRASLSRLQSKLNKLNRSGSNKEAKELRESVIAFDSSMEELRMERARNHVQSDLLQRDLTNLEKRKSELLKSIEVDSRNIVKEGVLREVKSKLERFVSAFKEQRRKNLEVRICDALKDMLHKEHLLDHVSIELDNSGMDLKLINAGGIEIPKDDLSMGEKQLYAIALLKALIDESGMSFPVVIDSPLQKLDKEHALTLLETVLPALSEQVFILPIPVKEFSEREYEAVRPTIHSLHLIEHGETASNIVRCSAKEFFAQTENVLAS